jgi:hypothetical protein
MNRVDHLQQELAGPAHQLLLSDVEIQNEHEIRNVLDAIGRLCINRSQIEGQCPGSDGLRSIWQRVDVLDRRVRPCCQDRVVSIRHHHDRHDLRVGGRASSSRSTL